MTGLSFGLVKDGEPIPQECGGYPMRTGNLCLELSGRGHEVCWYSSTFSHHQKTFRFEEDTTLLELGFRQRFLSSGGYTRNISPGRFLHHSRFALKLYKELLQTPRLDVIVCCIPMLEAALASTLAANRRGIPLVLDIRDPWPDVFLTLLPRALRPAGAVVFYPYRELARRLFARADSLTACSEGFLEWAQRISARPAIRREQDRVFFHGAHCPPVDPSALPQAWQTGPGVIRHIYLGGFGRNYDFEVMEKVIKALAEDRRHHFFMVGTGSEQQQRLRSRLGDFPVVHFTAWLPREEAYRLARSCHLGWLPLAQGNDGFLPNKPFEYSALGLAQVVGKASEVGRLVREHDLGIEYDQKRPDDLVESLRELSFEKISAWQSNATVFWREKGDAKECAAGFAEHLERIATDTTV